jgi:hypothetical protein
VLNALVFAKLCPEAKEAKQAIQNDLEEVCNYIAKT